MLKGKKAYIISIFLLCYALGGYFTGNLGGREAIDLLFSGGALASLRAGIDNSIKRELGE